MALTALLAGLSHPHSLAHLRTLVQTPEIDAILLWDGDDRTFEAGEVRATAKVTAAGADLTRPAWSRPPAFSAPATGTPGTRGTPTPIPPAKRP